VVLLSLSRAGQIESDQSNQPCEIWAIRGAPWCADQTQTTKTVQDHTRGGRVDMERPGVKQAGRCSSCIPWQRRCFIRRAYAQGAPAAIQQEAWDPSLGDWILRHAEPINHTGYPGGCRPRESRCEHLFRMAT
jgi:hypothetical protein